MSQWIRKFSSRCPEKKLGAGQSTQSAARRLCDGRLGINTDGFFELGPSAGGVVKILIDQSEMVTIAGVAWISFYGILQKRSGNRKCSVVEVCPGECIGSICQIRESSPCGLRQGKSNVHAATVFQQDISEVIRSKRIIGFECQSFLIYKLGCFPVSLLFINASERDMKLRHVRCPVNGTLVVRDGLAGASLSYLHLGKQY